MSRQNMKLFASMILLLTAVAMEAADTSYFPKDSISNFEQQWYGQQLAAMKEPVLSIGAKEKSYFVFRVLYLPTWGRPVAVRIEKKGGEIIRRVVLLSGDGGYDPGSIKEEKTERISDTEFSHFQSELEKSRFWTLAVKDDVRGADGSELIIEAIKDGKYVVFSRWTPEAETEKRGLTAVFTMTSRLFQDAGFWRKK
jgi:hypothetical protein